MNAQMLHGRGIVILALALAFMSPSDMQAKGQRSLTSAERFVLDHVKAGEQADLDRSQLSDHSLSADFVADLITGRYKTAALERQGVKIAHAVLSETLIVASESVPYSVWFKSCKFEGGVDFEYTRFGRDLSFEGSTFGRPGDAAAKASATNALFIGMKVDGPVNFNQTWFYVPLNLTYAEAGSEFLFDDVHYESPENADFESLKAKEPVFFRRDHFMGKLVLADAQLFELFIENPLPPGTIDLDLTQARIEHEVSIQNATLSSFRAPFLFDAGEATFDQVVPVGTVTLIHSHFQNLTIRGFDSWLKVGSLNLEGLSFEGIDIPDAKVAPQASRLLDLIQSDRCPYSPQPYMELEKFLRTHGNPQKADEVYIAMHRGERKQLSWWKQPFDVLLDVLVGYGRKPWRAVVGVLILAVAGAFAFTRGSMEPEDKSTDTWYNPFWYSLDLLSPIDLGIAKKWRASESHNRLRDYAQIHRFLGWILIPLVVAAITGLIK